MIITRQQLKELLSYDLESGIFTWLILRGRAKTVAGTPNHNGYIQICVCRRSYMAHKLAWLYVHGCIPKILDHVNGVTSDNRLCNLRIATPTLNQWNRKKSKNNSVGYAGVTRHRRKYAARIMVNRKYIWLGSFDNPVTAGEAYAKAAKQYRGDWVRSSPHRESP